MVWSCFGRRGDAEDRGEDDSAWRRFTREHAGCWPVGHLAGWVGPSGFSSRSTALEVVRAVAASGATSSSSSCLNGQVAVVTGGNSGIGFETARALAHGGARVILACRDVVKGEKAAAAISSEVLLRGPAASTSTSSSATTALSTSSTTASAPSTSSSAARPSPSTSPPVTCMALDLASFSSVRRFAADFLRLGLPLHLLVHNGKALGTPLLTVCCCILFFFWLFFPRNTHTAGLVVCPCVTALAYKRPNPISSLRHGGVMPCPFLLTEDGHETPFQVNFLSPFLLTKLLTWRMRESTTTATTTTANNNNMNGSSSCDNNTRGVARVILVTSAVHRFSYRAGIRLDHVSGESAAIGYDPVASYAQSKLAMVLYARDLDCRLRTSRRAGEGHIGVFAVHPGAVITPGSERARIESGGARGAVLHRVGRPFLKTMEQGAATTVYCCVGAPLEKSGRYFSNCNEAEPAAAALNIDLARDLWQRAETMTAVQKINKKKKKKKQKKLNLPPAVSS